MSFGIEVQNDHNYAIDAAALSLAAEQTLLACAARTGSGLSIVVSSDETVRALNKEHRNVDAVTDVLSFSAESLPPEISEETALYHGDLVIAYPYASTQADVLGHDRDDSLSLLVVHGTLHLLGYDHDTPQNRTKMWRKQAEILAVLSIDEGIVPALESADHA